MVAMVIWSSMMSCEEANYDQKIIVLVYLHCILILNLSDSKSVKFYVCC
jgi:hypothetical protein